MHNKASQNRTFDAGLASARLYLQRYDMNYGNWEKSILISIVSGYLLLALWLFGSQIIDGYIFTVAEQMLVIGVGSITYWGLSIFGWALIGIPVHFSLCKWAKPKWRFYLYACCLVILVLWAIYGLPSAFFFGTAIMFQASVFRYNVFKTKTSPSRRPDEQVNTVLYVRESNGEI